MEVLSPNAGFPTEQKNYFFVIIFDVIIIIIAVIITMVEGCSVFIYYVDAERGGSTDKP